MLSGDCAIRTDTIVIAESPNTEEQVIGRANKAHVALYMQSFAGGGAERIMVNLAQGLAGRGLRVDMVVARAEGPYLSMIPSGVRLVDLKCRRSLTSLPGLAHYLRRERPAALLSAMGASNLIALAAKSLAKFPGRVIISVHVNLSAHYQHERGIKSGILPFLYRRFYARADAVVAVSQEAAADLTESFGLPPGRIRMIYNPVVTSSLFEQAKQPIHHRWFGPGQIPVVISVGRLCEQKDFLSLIQAFAKVRAHRPVRLVILGEGPDRPRLEAAVSEMGLSDCVELPGFVSNPYAFMAQSALYVLSSRWEGLPTVLIEALACGLPVVSTDCPSGPREILHDGQYGILVAMGDVDALAQAIEASLVGPNVPASSESWAVFETAFAAERYEQALLEN